MYTAEAERGSITHLLVNDFDRCSCSFVVSAASCIPLIGLFVSSTRLWFRVTSLESEAKILLLVVNSVYTAEAECGSITHLLVNDFDRFSCSFVVSAASVVSLIGLFGTGALSNEIGIAGFVFIKLAVDSRCNMMLSLLREHSPNKKIPPYEFSSKLAGYLSNFGWGSVPSLIV